LFEIDKLIFNILHEAAQSSNLKKIYNSLKKNKDDINKDNFLKTINFLLKNEIVHR